VKLIYIYTAAIAWGSSALAPFNKSMVVTIKSNKSITGVNAKIKKPSFLSLNIYLIINPNIITIQKEISQKTISQAI